MSRKTRTNFPGAFRVVLVKSWGTEYKGPYQTLAAAKGQLTPETMCGPYYAPTKRPGVEGWIERTTGAWERVE